MKYFYNSIAIIATFLLSFTIALAATTVPWTKNGTTEYPSYINDFIGIASSSPMSPLSVVGNENHYGAYSHFGLAAPLSQCNTALGASSCIELVGNDNTTGGVGVYEANINNGTSAYGGYVLTNSLQGNATTNYSGIFLNSPVYTDTTFGTSEAVPNLLQLGNSMGPVSIQSFSSTTAASYINFYAAAVAPGAGLPASNEGMRLTPTGLGIGTTSPFAPLSLEGNALFSGTGKTNAFFVGTDGTTTPSFQINNSAATSGNGLAITTTAAGSGVTLAAVSANPNDGFNIGTKGTGTMNLQLNGSTKVSISNGTFQVNSESIVSFTSLSSSNTAGSARFSFTSANDGALTASAEAPLVSFNMSGTRTHATGAIAVQRDFRINGTTHNFAAGTAAANTIASTTPFEIDGPNPQGTLANYTNDYGMFIGQGTALTASTTNAYGLAVQAPIGATNNYALQVLGRVLAPNLTASAGLQTGVVCVGSGGELINDSVACLASAARFKQNIQPLSSSTALTELMQIQPVTYEYKPEFNGALQSNPNYSGEFKGFIADEVGKIDPTLISIETSTTTGAINSYPGQPAGLKIDNIVAVLWAATQQIATHQSKQDEEIATLQAEVTALQNNQQVYTMCRI